MLKLKIRQIVLHLFHTIFTLLFKYLWSNRAQRPQPVELVVRPTQKSPDYTSEGIKLESFENTDTAWAVSSAKVGSRMTLRPRHTCTHAWAGNRILGSNEKALAALNSRRHRMSQGVNNLEPGFLNSKELEFLNNLDLCMYAFSSIIKSPFC